ncbi:MAG TPA: type II secretion system F family protein [Acidimicrobiales bacterium]
MTVALIAGMVAGAGLWLAWTGLRPAPEPLSVALARLDRRPPRDAAARAATEDRDMRFGGFLLRHLPALARSIDRMRADLRVVGRSPEEHAARVGSYVLWSLVLGPWVAVVAWLAGANLPPIVPLVITVGGASWGLVVPFVTLRQLATARRKAFAHALSAYCNVTVMSLAAGRGVEQALETASTAGQGWAFAEIRGALTAGYVRGEPPWESLGRLGTELGIDDLTELSSTISMAGEEGAAVRETVSAKARTIRERITADTEQAAAAVTERMSLPTVLMVMGFLVFLAYPAVTVLFSFGE